MSRSLPVVPRSSDPELRRFLEELRGTVQDVSGATRSVADKSSRFITMADVMERFPALLRERPGQDGDSIYEDGIYEPGVFAATDAAAPVGLVRTLWLHEPVTVTGPTWLDTSAHARGVVYHGGRKVFHNYRTLYAEAL